MDSGIQGILNPLTHRHVNLPFDGETLIPNIRSQSSTADRFPGTELFGAMKFHQKSNSLLCLRGTTFLIQDLLVFPLPAQKKRPANLSRVCAHYP
jgi:hypothetical protein